MAGSRHTVLALSAAGVPTSGKHIFVYKAGLYVSSSDRVQLVDTDNNGVYYFDTENANLKNGDLPNGRYDIGIYASAPGSGDHTTVYNAQKQDERENRYFGSKDTLTVLAAHIANVSNPHTVTLAQALAADAGTSATTAQIEELRAGGATSLHSHSGTTPAAHHTSHEAGGGDVVTVKDGNLPAHGDAGACEAVKLHVTDAGSYYSEDDVEEVLQEIGVYIAGALSAPANLSGSAVSIFGGKAALTITWDKVTAASKYTVYLKNKDSAAISYISVSMIDTPTQMILPIVAKSVDGWEVKVRAERLITASSWSSVVTIGGIDWGITSTDYDALKTRIDKVCDASGGPTGTFAQAIVAISDAVSALTPLLIETVSDVHTSTASETGWEDIVDPIPFTKTSNTNYLVVTCNLKTTDAAEPAELRLQFEEPDTTLHPSDAVKTTATSDGNEVTYWFEIGGFAATGNCKAHVEYKNEDAAESAEVNTLNVSVKV